MPFNFPYSPQHLPNRGVADGGDRKAYGTSADRVLRFERDCQPQESSSRVLVQISISLFSTNFS